MELKIVFTVLAWSSAIAQCYRYEPRISAAAIIDKLQLQPNVGEGGYFRQTFIDDQTDANGRSVSTAIYFLINGTDVSKLHKLDATEVWHFYLGDSLEIVELGVNGSTITQLGPCIFAGQMPQHAVNPGVWFGARLARGGRWGLVGTTVAPGFLASKSELGKRSDLLALYPESGPDIVSLTVPDGDD